MSAKTGIEWTEATWNPLVGCTKVSPGCDHCYAETLVNRFAGHNKGFPNRFDVVTLRDDRMLTQPLRWRTPKRIFVNSLSDLFHKDVPDEFIARVFAVMALAPQHTFQLLTKRHGRMRSLLSSDRWPGLLDRAVYERLGDDATCRYVTEEDVAAAVRATAPDAVAYTPLPNLWLGVSVEDQARADLRIPALINTPAVVRFLSCEPLLGPIAFARVPEFNRIGLDLSNWWVIAGGESGRGARPMHPDWVRSLRDQCAAARVPFLFKQWGEWAPAGYTSRLTVPAQSTARFEDVRPAEYWFPSPARHDTRLTHLVMQRVGKKAAGRELDGATHDGYPAEVAA